LNQACLTGGPFLFEQENLKRSYLMTKNPSIRELLKLKENVLSGYLSEDHLRRMLAESHYSRLSRKITEYLATGDVQALSFTPSEAFKTVIYHTTCQTGAPVMLNGEFVPAPSMDEATAELPAIYSRPYVVEDGMLVGYWQDEPVRRIELESGSVKTITRHAPLDLEWEGRTYTLVTEAMKKSFYFPMDSIPDYFKKWVENNEPQKKADLATGAKRQGIRLHALSGIPLSPALMYTQNVPTLDGKLQDVYDQGVLVVMDERWNAIQDELGLKIAALQGTIWYQNGCYFKGTIIGERLAKLPVGYYGGVKSPTDEITESVSLFGGIMDEYSLVPWTASVNRQQTDYADLELPLNPEFPSAETFTMAASGFPAYVNKLNDSLIAASSQVFRKSKVQGIAGKWGITNEDCGSQFIVRGPSIHNRHTKTMVFLFSPSLPVHTKLMKVRVTFIPDENLAGNIILVNMNKRHWSYNSNIFISLQGRDADGDSATLTDDPELLRQSYWPDEVRFFDTTQFKSMKDLPVRDAEAALRTSVGRMRNSEIIGKADNLMRRFTFLPFLVEGAEGLTWERRILGTEAIQRGISAQKKNSGAEMFQGYYWALKDVPPHLHDYLLPGKGLNPHDWLASLKSASKAWIKALHAHSNDPSPLTDKKVNDAEALYRELLAKLEPFFPAETDAARTLLELLMPNDEAAIQRMKTRGRTLFETAQSRCDDATLIATLEAIDKSKRLWQSIAAAKSGEDEPVMSFTDAAAQISAWLYPLAEKNYTLLIGAMLTEFSNSLLSYLITIDDIRYIGLLDRFTIPVKQSLPKGMLVTLQVLQRIATRNDYLSLLNGEMTYEIIASRPLGKKTILTIKPTERS
jgi:hypothetical protein